MGINWNCKWFPEFSEISDVLFYSRIYRTPGKADYWRCEAFATYLTLIGVILVFWFGATSISDLDPTDAFMASSIVKTNLCCNLTCGGHYCSFTQPASCGKTPIYLQKNEVGEFCTPDLLCDWTAEILADAGYDNRSSSLYIYNNNTGEKKYFPQLDSMKMQYVDITKYINSQSGHTLVSWDVVPRTLSSKMISCGDGLPNAVKTSSRCGAYNIYLSNTVYESAMKQRYYIDFWQIVFVTLTSVVTVVIIFWALLYVYRYAKTFETAIAPPHRD